ncbi:MAG TPA: hypothetical protein VHC69_06820 [Polyangiaceae bacterium]|nr:hypothetical protein [Polyangiaceae bacterium]
MNAPPNSELLVGFKDDLRECRKRIFERWRKTEQNGDLAWTIMTLLEGLNDAERQLDSAIQDERAGEASP